MDTDKAAYWIAVGVLALGLNAQYRQGNFVALHRVGERAGELFCRISAGAEQRLALFAGRERLAAAEVLAAAEKSELALGQRQLVREQSRERAEFLRDQIRAQADLARAQAEIRRAAIEQIRSRGDFEFRPESDGSRGLTVLCPKTYARILARTERAADVVSARVEVGDSF